ncbi:TetR/AcrR family transcriptional regulator [bacterium]|nr:TetR/AcrR family transcriptional regulator [bacterium]
MSTSDDIVEIAKELIQTRGYNAFSYQDIAQSLKIKTSSIHYHFSKKSDLGQAVVIKYIQHFHDLLKKSDQCNFQQRWQQYLAPFAQVSEAGVKICLCGALGGEFVSLPKEIQNEVILFFDLHETWLEKFLSEGQKEGQLNFNGEARDLALHIFSSLQGALMIARTKQDLTYFKVVVNSIEDLLGFCD